MDRALRAHKRRGWLDALYEIQKRIREEEEELRILKQREQQFQNREYFHQFHPSKEEERREEEYSGCSALTERRRRRRNMIAQREDFPECHAYLEDLERRRYHRLCIEYEEAMLALRLNYKPGQKE